MKRSAKSQAKAFNDEIKSIIKSSPKSNASIAIAKIKRKHPTFKDYYSLMDNFNSKIGVVLIAQEFVHAETDKSLGYQPCIRYIKNNKLGKDEDTIELASSGSLMPLDECYSKLASELAYRLGDFRKLDKILEEI